MLVPPCLQHGLGKDTLSRDKSLGFENILPLGEKRKEKEKYASENTKDFKNYSAL
jgi:hypothetical protein